MTTNSVEAMQVKLAKSLDAVSYLLNRSLRDDKLYYQIGRGTEAFRLLTLAYAELTGEPVDDIEKRYGS